MHKRDRNIGRRAAAGVMVTLTLAIYPMQTALASRIAYYLNHGINSTDGVWQGATETIRENPNQLPAYPGGGNYNLFDALNGYNEQRQKVRSDIVAHGGLDLGGGRYGYSWDTKTIPQQAQELAANIQAREAANPSDHIILYGFSQGGLRSRHFVQNMKGAPHHDTVRGLITMDVPNHGAPIVNNIPAVTFRIFSAATTALPVMGPFFYGLKEKFNQDIQKGLIGAGADDMRPASSFLQSLNAENCEWRTRTETHSFLWYTWNVTVWYQVCTGLGTRSIPSNVGTLEIRGQNSSIDSYVAGHFNQTSTTIRNWRHGFAAAATVASAAAFGVAWLMPWMVTVGVGLANLAELLWNLPNYWRTSAMGATEGDAIVPVESQMLHRPGGSDLGGDPELRQSLTIPEGQHGGLFSVANDERTLDMVRVFEERLRDRVANAN